MEKRSLFGLVTNLDFVVEVLPAIDLRAFKRAVSGHSNFQQFMSAIGRDYRAIEPRLVQLCQQTPDPRYLNANDVSIAALLYALSIFSIKAATRAAHSVLDTPQLDKAWMIAVELQNTRDALAYSDSTTTRWLPTISDDQISTISDGTDDSEAVLTARSVRFGVDSSATYSYGVLQSSDLIDSGSAETIERADSSDALEDALIA